MAGLAAGADTFFLVAPFALLVESIFGFRSLGPIMAAAAGAGLDTIVVAGIAITNFVLVSLVGEIDIPHLGGELDFGRAVVGGNQGGGTEGDQTDGDHYSDQTFHDSLLLQKVGWLRTVHVKRYMTALYSHVGLYFTEN